VMMDQANYEWVASPDQPGVFEGELRYVKTPCDQPSSFYFRAYGTMLSTYECTYDYTP